MKNQVGPGASEGVIGVCRVSGVCGDLNGQEHEK